MNDYQTVKYMDQQIERGNIEQYQQLKKELQAEREAHNALKIQFKISQAEDEELMMELQAEREANKQMEHVINIAREYILLADNYEGILEYKNKIRQAIYAFDEWGVRMDE